MLPKVGSNQALKFQTVCACLGDPTAEPTGEDHKILMAGGRRQKGAEFANGKICLFGIRIILG